MRTWSVLLSVATLLAAAAWAEKPAATSEPKKDELLAAETFRGLAFRSLGPAIASGRIGDLAVNPQNPAEYYVAVSSGGVWKTSNWGTTFTPIFDDQGSYSIGCVTLDPNNPHVVWVGTGENNSQRSVSWGDGVYRSLDGGKSWKHMGLARSEHIGMIRVDPRDSNVVYVAAQGPLWAPGGDRGLYKTTDGGQTWNAILTVSPNTGVSEVHLDPRNPDVLYATTYQRRRHVWTLINGGPESTIYKSTDAGASWRKVDSGLPKVDKGRIGLAISPANPDILFAIVEAAEKESGVFRSTNRGESWERRSRYMTTSGQYYNELFADPRDPDLVYAMDTWLHASKDGGKTWARVGEKTKHVDNHAMWIDPARTAHWLVGCDGGIYETHDAGATWDFKANLPVTQFYRVAVDTSLPFYYIYGGTQDNNSMGGPSRTTSASGIVNTDWFFTNGGDGFVSRIDPTDPNIVYAESQYGGLVRYDRASGEVIDIQPQEGANEAPNRWNWDSPLIISPHAPTRLYFASQRLYRSDDRGDHWVAVSGDLTRQIDRNRLPVMDKVWPADAVAKNASTSFYGNIVSLSESPKVEGLLYVGTDDGLVQVSEDGGATWRRIERFPGVPERTYVSRLEASLHAADTVYAAFDNHKMGDFKPYLLRSTDRGRTWTSIAGDLPVGQVVYALAEDPEEPRLLFAGCEFGVFFTLDGGSRWIQLKGGLPTIAVRDLAIQARENDLVLGTFGRGFFVLDDYTPLRGLDRATLERPAVLFPVKKAWAYVEKQQLGGRGKASLGDSFFTADNPPFGAVFTYYLGDGLKTLVERRHDREKEAVKTGAVMPYPTPEELRAEAAEEKPAVVLTVTDADGNVVRRLEGPATKGFSRIAWDLRFPAAVPAREEAEERDPWDWPDVGPLVVPGTYTVSMATRVGGVLTPVPGSQSFEVEPLGHATLPAADRPAVLTFQRQAARLQRAVLGAAEVVKDVQARLKLVKIALRDTPAAPAALEVRAREIESRLRLLDRELRGDRVLAARNEPVPPSIVGRVQNVVYTHWASTAGITGTQRQNLAIAGELFERNLAALRQLVEVELRGLEAAMEKAGAPYTPGRLPVWTRE
ncbi:MAG TPA: hypothetical protein P5234_01245 [Thermoanaerobaculaceae bacterium]|nr:hypothetical protein [Thermoanaerobaculaceae bacterium]HRS14853.1 hypothetical protein [Thermoanaerobaculaceae bacterium]